MKISDKTVGNLGPENEALRTSEAKLCKMFLDEAPFAAFIFKGEKFCCYVNHSAEVLTGYSRDELFNLKYWDIVHPDFRELVRERGRLRQKGISVPSRYEIKIIARNGDVRWVDLNTAVIKLDGDQFVLATAIDISDRKGSEETLKLAQFSVETSADAIFWMTPEGGFFDVNPAACKELGYTREELKSLHVWDIDPLYPRERWPETWRNQKEKGSVKFETLHRTKAGKLIPVEIIANYLRYNDAEYACAISRDITERKRAEEALRESERKFRALFDGTFQFIGLLAIDGTLLDVNRPALELVASAKYDVVGKPFWETPWCTYSTELQEKIRASIKNAARGEFVRFETIIRASDGALHYIDYSIKPMIDETGKVMLLIPEGRDITGLKRVEKELEDAKNHAELYLDLMGHDINNFNHIALGYLELARDMIKSGGTLGRDHLELIEKPLTSLNNSSRLIENVRKLRDTRELRLERVDICTVLARLKDRYSHFMGKAVTIHYAPPTECFIMANAIIDEIFINLIENSIKHSLTEKPLAIDIVQTRVTEAGKDYARIAIEDNGPGITDDMKEKLFTRLYRGRTTAKGKGLGLYLVKTLVEDFHGKVWVEDRVPGDPTKGAKFVVLLPAA